MPPESRPNHIIPEKVAEAMRIGGSMVTCMPVQLDRSEQWEAAIFFRLSGAESSADLAVISACKTPLSLGIETDLIEHANATVVVLGLEIDTLPDNPLRGEILLASGEAFAHFEALKLLAVQPKLCWFFCDEHFSVVYSQQHALHDAHRAEFSALLQRATTRDALIRASSKYDAQSAFQEIVSHYEFR